MKIHGEIPKLALEGKNQQKRLNWNSALETGGVLVSESSFEYRITILQQ
jgi:hypothetical protein